MSVSNSIFIQTECSICLSPIPSTTQKTETSCHHTFHNVCLEKWLKIGDSCPLCRHNLMRFVSFEQVIAATEKCRMNHLDESEARHLFNQYLKGVRFIANEKRRIRELNIETIKKEYTELEQLDFRDEFSLMKLNLLKKRIEKDAREKKSSEDFVYMLIFAVAFCIFISLPNAKPEGKTCL